MRDLDKKKQCNLIHVYSEISSFEVNKIYFQVSTVYIRLQPKAISRRRANSETRVSEGKIYAVNGKCF